MMKHSWYNISRSPFAMFDETKSKPPLWLFCHRYISRYTFHNKRLSPPSTKNRTLFFT